MDFIISLLIVLPLVGAFVVLFVPKKSNIKNIALLFSILNFINSLSLYFLFDKEASGFQFEEGPFYWIRSLGIGYHVGIDGINLFLVLLTTFLTPIVILSSYSYITKRVKEYLLFILLIESSMIGTFVSIDLFLFYIFWEFTLIPMYFLIGIWGGEQRIYATVKFFLYTMFGSLFMLIAIIVLGLIAERQNGNFSTDLFDLLQLNVGEPHSTWLFFAFFIAFAIKVPLFPFHTWLPDAHVQAPTGGSVILAALLLKMGAYGLIRFAIPLFPETAAMVSPIITIICLIGIVYGAFLALAQDDIKKLVAYSSISHMGYVVLGIFALTMPAVEGAIYQMVNHGLSTGALFLIVGVLYERRHTKLISEFGGIAKVMPLFAAIFMITTLSSIGLPGLNGFIGEFLILTGTFVSKLLFARGVTIIAATGIILSACYMLWMYQRVIFGAIKNDANKNLLDLSLRERFVFIPVIALIFTMGIYTTPFTSKMDASVRAYIDKYERKVELSQNMR